MAALLDDHDLGIVIAPAVVMAVCPPTVKSTIVMTMRPPTMKTAIMIAMFRDYDCSILRICGYGWQHNCDRA